MQPTNFVDEYLPFLIPFLSIDFIEVKFPQHSSTCNSAESIFEPERLAPLRHTEVCVLNMEAK